LDCGSLGLAGTIEFPWLEGRLTQLMIDVEWSDGSHLLRVVTAGAPHLTVYSSSSSGWKALQPVIFDYARLGIDHILSGCDHLIFVIALALLVRVMRLLIATITAFTVAHTLTLASTALGWLSVPLAPVEAMIAMSVVLVCAECLDPTESLTRRKPWLVAFAFGLLHGLGFASALLEIGLPERHVPSALFSFNLGVELGQLAVIAAFLLGSSVLSHFRLKRAWMTRALVYGMGVTAAFWSIERGFAVFHF
jgi:hydrogenase/urease accessory protein HupE